MNHQYLIDKFFESSLSEQEQTLFDQLLTEDPEFRKEFELQQDLSEVIGHHERNEMKKQLQSIEANQKKPTRKRWYIAAAVTLLIVFSGVWYSQNHTPDPDAIFAEYYQPYRNVLSPIVRNSDDTNLISVAFTAYEQGRHKEAIQHFNKLEDEHDPEIIRFYKANSLLALGRTEEAIAILEKNIASVDTLQEKHNWYLALAHLKMNNTAEAVRYLQILNKDASSEYKKKEVGYLLKKLD